MARIISWICKGMCLGVANVIPGVSGGTMALVLGIYERLIDAIHKIGPQTVKAIFPPYPNGLPTKWKAEWKRIDFFFLCWLGVGAAVAIVIAAKVIPTLMVQAHDPTYGFFWGLILASIAIPWRMLKRIGWQQVLGLVIAAALTAGLSYSFASQSIAKAKRKAAIKAAKQQAPVTAENTVPAPVPIIEEEHLNASPTRLLYLVLAGALAISAMILPGISGSFVLLLMGAYFDLFQAIDNLRSLDLHPNNFLIVGSVGIGTIVGILGFTRFLNYVFKRYHDVTVATLIGLMLGSLYGIWPFRKFAVIGGKRIDGMPIWPEMNANLMATLAACLVGIATIVAFIVLEKRTGRNEGDAPA